MQWTAIRKISVVNDCKGSITNYREKKINKYWAKLPETTYSSLKWILGIVDGLSDAFKNGATMKVNKKFNSEICWSDGFEPKFIFLYVF